MSGHQAAPSPRTQPAKATEVSATIQLLSRSDVEKDLGITAEQYSQLSQVARTLSTQSVTEDTACASVSKVLTATQMSRLTELLVRYLGYGSLALSSVRSKLELTTEQQAQIANILSQLSQSRQVVQSTATSDLAAARGKAELQKQANTLLGKVLTSEQDASLRTLAGKALGSL